MAAYRAPFPAHPNRAVRCSAGRVTFPPALTILPMPDLQRIDQALPQFAPIPVLLIWGMQDPVLTEPVLRMWQRLYPHRDEAHELEDADHFLQEIAPERIVGWIQQFLVAHP